MEIKSLANTGFDTIFGAFAQAFAGYEVQLGREQLQKMITRRGFAPGLSFAAFEGDQIVAFTLNGVGNFKGTLTAYDTGTGTLSEYRGKGLAKKIFEYSIPYLKEAGIRQYLLEVLQHNSKAISVYQKLGFEVTREFNYLIQDSKVVCSPAQSSDLLYSIKSIRVEEYDAIPGFWEFQPSWQNSLEAIKRVPDHFVSLGIFIADRLVGYIVFEPTSGDITQIAVDRDYRRRGIGSLLLNEIFKLNESEQIKVINTDVSCCKMTRFLEEKNIHVQGKQFEMIKTL